MWKALNSTVSWLPDPPYIIGAERVAQLTLSLRESGFGCYVIDVPSSVVERSLLQSLGMALNLPDHYKATWDSFHDCIHEITHLAPVKKAVILNDSHNLLLRGPYLFARVTHLLCQTTEGIEIAERGAAQLEYVFAGEWSSVILDPEV